MIVVAIIGILAATILPAYRDYVEQADPITYKDCVKTSRYKFAEGVKYTVYDCSDGTIEYKK